LKRVQKKKSTYRNLVEAWKESRYELDDLPEVLGCLGISVIVALLLAGV